MRLRVPASCFRNKMCCRRCQPTTVKVAQHQERPIKLVVWGVWHATQLADAEEALSHASWPGVQHQKVWPADAVTQGLCDYTVCALKMAIHFTKGNKLQPLREFISAYDDRARVCMGDLAKHKRLTDDL